ncbi:MAG TPA: PEGA domain-containing protein [Verrucomicrobiae bacterium]|nr:PEGA domain-containing protein [Verrucomicrobiae bacterium]
MTLKSRFLLIAIGLVIFLAASPFLVLFARGYKYDFSKRQIVKTGSLIVRTEPSHAEILLNGKKNRADTPTTIRFLSPQDYIVTIKKPGYQDWTKRLGIHSELVTWANLDREYIALFFVEPKILKEMNSMEAILSPDYKELLVLSQDKVSSINLNENQEQTLTPASYLNLILTNSNTINKQTAYQLLKNPNTIPFSNEQILASKKIISNNNYHAILSGGSLMITNLQSNPVFAIDDIQDFILDDQILWFLEGNQLRRRDLRSNNNELLHPFVPAAADARLIRADGSLFLHLDKSLYILNDNLDLIYGNVSYAHFDPRSKQLVYANDHEIFLFNLNSQKSNLILRSSSVISQPIINSETGYVFFGNEGKIKAIEIDGRDHRNIYNIANFTKSFTLSENGKLLYVFDDSSVKVYQIR